MSEFFCRTCVLHDRATVVATDGTPPSDPCPHEGEGPNDCKRTEWRRRTWYCAHCQLIGKPTIVEADVRPRSCPRFPLTHHTFALTREAAYAFRDTKLSSRIKDVR